MFSQLASKVDESVSFFEEFKPNFQANSLISQRSVSPKKKSQQKVQDKVPKIQVPSHDQKQASTKPKKQEKQEK